MTALVRDPTPMVRNDPTDLLCQEISWTVLVNAPELLLDSPYIARGQFVFRVTGTAPFGCSIESSTNMADWKALSTNALVSGECWVTNAVEWGAGKCFFRARAL